MFAKNFERMSFYHFLTENSQYIFPNLYKIRFFKKQLGLTQHNILERKIEPELFWISQFLSRDAVFLDVGANLGSYLFQLEKHLLPENIYAFEPNKTLAKRLKRLFPKIHVSEVALSNENTTAQFKIPVIQGQKVHTRGTLQTYLKENEEEISLTQEVKVISLDEWILKQKIQKIDFIKIDVEGNEMKTLLGAKNTIFRLKPVLMVEMEQRHHEEKISNLIEQIESWGYDSYYLERENFKLAKLNKEFILSQNAIFVKDYKNYINNIIFIPTDKSLK